MSTEVAVTKAGTLRNMLSQYKAEIAHALPKHVSPDRMLRIAMTSARKTPGLLECTPESFLGAVIQCSQLGLEPDTPLGHGWLLPFFNKATGQKEVNFMPGYRGFMDLVYRVPSHPIMLPSVVYEGDKFAYEMGLHPVLEHTPMPRMPNAELTHAYAVASFPDGRKVFWVMARTEIEGARARSQSKGFSPWKTDYDAMAMKTVLRRICKYLPMSAELQTTVGLDESAEDGRSQHNDLLLRGEKIPLKTKTERIENKMSGDPESFDNFKE